MVRCENGVCVCRNKGYAYSGGVLYGSGGVCRDVNECTTDQNNCSKLALCTNTDGGFRCTCQHGLVGDGITCKAATPSGNNIEMYAKLSPGQCSLLGFEWENFDKMLRVMEWTSINKGMIIKLDAYFLDNTDHVSH